MRLEKFLVNEDGRSKVITIDEWCAIAKKKHLKTLKKLIDNNDVLWRGHTSLSLENFGYVNPKQGRDRKSANTQNYYTVWIDNSPKWKAYPKRSKSLICSNVFGHAYGDKPERYMILPEDDSNIAIASSIDFWDAFRKTSPSDDIDGFNYNFRLLYKNYIGGVLPPHLSIGKLKKSINSIDEFIDKHGYDGYGVYSDQNSVLKLMKNENKTLMEAFDYIFDPTKNDFKLIKSYQPIPPAPRECWTDGKSLMLNGWSFRKAQEYNNDNYKKIKSLVT